MKDLHRQMDTDPGCKNAQVNEKALSRRVRTQVIGRKHNVFAVVHPGFEQIACEELERLGVGRVLSCKPGGVELNARLADIYRMNLCAGTVSRFLMRLVSFQTLSLRQFTKKMRDFPWELYIQNGAELTFNLAILRSRLRYPRLLTDSLSEAIQRRLAEFDRRVAFPSQPDQKAQIRHQCIFVRADENKFQISLDTSGDLLYLRGYQRRTENAPIRETLARSILLAADVEHYDVLIDPFAGSGTFSIEAAVMFSSRSPGVNRAFAFENWPAFSLKAFHHLKRELIANTECSLGTTKKTIHCSDISHQAVSTIAHNLKIMELGDWVLLDRRDFLDLPPPNNSEKTLLVMNPPYGSRLGTISSTEKLYRQIGAKIRKDFIDCGYAIIVPSLKLEKVLSLPYDRKILFTNGGKKVSLLLKIDAGVSRTARCYRETKKDNNA